RRARGRRSPRPDHGRLRGGPRDDDHHHAADRQDRSPAAAAVDDRRARPAVTDGKGSIATDKAWAAGEAQAAARARAVTIGTIVCVDDQAEVRRLLGDVFRARGSNVVGFDDGEDAITWLSANDADLVVLDLDLGPGRRSGIEICRAIRARMPDLPI